MQLLVFQQEGDGMRFSFVTSDCKDMISQEWECKSVGYATFWIANVLSENAENLDIDDMVITIPSLYKCPELVYCKKRGQFMERSKASV